MTMYFSKWRKEWVEFKNQPPSEGELTQMLKLKYQINYGTNIKTKPPR